MAEFMDIEKKGPYKNLTQFVFDNINKPKSKRKHPVKVRDFNKAVVDSWFEWSNSLFE